MWSESVNPQERAFMDVWQLVGSILSGGLAGGCVSTVANRTFYLRSLRTRFFPRLDDMHSAYVLRMESQEGRYLLQVPNFLPLRPDAEFVNHRTQFIGSLAQFNELKEARDLRKKIVKNQASPSLQTSTGSGLILDLLPEYEALSACVALIHKKLGLW
jgi:hypothetical protein